MDQLHIKFTHHNTVRDKKPYTIYEIELRANNTIQWVIYKRYSHFDSLHIALTKSNLPSTIKSRLPLLPPKRLTRSLASEFVEKRKIELDEYLCKLIEVNEILHHPILLNFIECPDSVRSQLLQYNGLTNNNNTTTHLDSNNNTIQSMNEFDMNHKFGVNISQLSYDDKRIYELCYELKYHTNKVNTIKQYEEYFFNTRPKLNNNSIKHLLTGTDGNTPLYVPNNQQISAHRDSASTNASSNNNNTSVRHNNNCITLNDRQSSHNNPINDRSTPGLIHICGDISYSHVASRAALYLLVRLLDVEKNKDAALFLDIFCTLDIPILKLLNLSQHVLNELGNRTGAYKLIQLLQNNSNTNNTHTQQQTIQFIESVVSSTEAIHEYHKWYEHISTQSLSSQHTQQHTIDPTLKSISLDNGYKHIALQCFQSILSVYHDTTNWRVVQPVHSLPKLNDINEQVCVSYKKDVSKDMVIVRCSSILPYTVQQSIELIGNVRRRKEWDCKFHSGSLIQALDSQHDILHLVFKSFSSPYKYRDFCVLQSYTQTQENGYIQACRSVTHSLAPEGKEHVRAVLYPTGYIITPLKDQQVNIHTNTGKLTQTNNMNTSSASPSTNTQHSHSPSSANATPYTTSPSVPTIYFPSPQHVSLHTQTIQQLPPVIGSDSNACLLTFIAQMDKESILIVSPDLLGETNELRNNMNSIKYCLGVDYGIRTLQPSVHTHHLMTQQSTVTQPSVKTSPQHTYVNSINQQDKSIQQLAAQNNTQKYSFQPPLPVTFNNNNNSPTNLKSTNTTS